MSVTAKRGKNTDQRKRGYGQYCALAKALDVVGDRWTLLIVRELLARGPCRYTDIRNGLPGIATNLLVARLRDLERAGVTRREEAPPPIATTLIHLTPRGEDLRSVVHAIGRWGGALLGEHRAGEAFCSHWLALPVELFLRDRTPDRPPFAIEVHCGDQPLVVETLNGAVRARVGQAAHPDVVLTGPPHLVLGVLTGRLSGDEATKQGLRHKGELKALRRIQPS
jgi:DNA-binding HxlR family transcriptional regulator